LFVANTFSDSISIVDVVNAKQIDQVSLGPQPKLSLAERGEMLFFDSRLSHDGWMSCHSCHTDGHSNGQLNDNLSDGSFDAPKRVLSLLGVGQTGPWAWNGKVETLEQQVRNSIQKTMQGEPPTDEQIAALVAFLETLPAPPVQADLTPSRSAAEIHRGEELFHSLDCQRCHAPPTYTSPQSYDVGLTDSVGNKEFNPPSLRGVGRRHALFHDSRATSLTDVLANHKHQLSRELSTSELNSLLQFLRSI
jgi:YVTN family beta-propeller protein